MKFTDLSSQQRSMLTMLCTGQVFNTEELGRGTMPKVHAQHSAQLLMDMREKGLVFSSQKTQSQSYANWRASEYGRDVFAGRPAEVVQAPAQRTSSSTASVDIWVVYHASPMSAVLVENFISESDAFTHAAKLTDRHGTQYHVAKLVARVKPVQQPTFEIERV